MTTRILRWTSLALLLAVAAPQATHAAQEDYTSVVDLAVATPELSTLVAAVVKADLVAALDARRQITVFAPTNDAFDAAAETILGPGNNGIDLVDALSVVELTNILLYHVSPGQRTAEDVLGSHKIRMLSKQFTVPSIAGMDAFINDAPITATDIFADNGVVHLIGGVLLP